MKNNVQTPSLTLLQRMFVLALVCVLGGITSDVYHYNKGVELQKRIDSLNARIYELHEIGYTIEASREIALVEFGFIPATYEYNALMED